MTFTKGETLSAYILICSAAVIELEGAIVLHASR